MDLVEIKVSIKFHLDTDCVEDACWECETPRKDLKVVVDLANVKHRIGRLLSWQRGVLSLLSLNHRPSAPSQPPSMLTRFGSETQTTWKHCPLRNRAP